MIKGPSKVFDLPQEKWVMVSGLMLSTLIPPLVFVSYLSDIFLTLKSKYKIVDGRNPKLDIKLANYVSSLASLFYYSSPIVVRRIGSILYEKMGYRYENDSFMCFYFMMFLIYLFVYQGCTPYADFRNQKKLLEEEA